MMDGRRASHSPEPGPFVAFQVIGKLIPLMVQPQTRPSAGGGGLNDASHRSPRHFLRMLPSAASRPRPMQKVFAGMKGDPAPLQEGGNGSFTLRDTDVGMHEPPELSRCSWITGSTALVL